MNEAVGHDPVEPEIQKKFDDLIFKFKVTVHKAKIQVWVIIFQGELNWEDTLHNCCPWPRVMWMTLIMDIYPSSRPLLSSEPGQIYSGS